MKRFIIPICLLTALLTSSCSDFLNAYSQDKIIAKEVSHLDELLLGSVYLPSYTSNGPNNSTGGFFNILDDDMNIGSGATNGNMLNCWQSYVSPLFGYYAWQLEVGRNVEGTNTANDSGLWNDLYKRINVVNVILDEIQDMAHDTDEDRATYYRVQGEALFCRAQFYFTLANLYGTAYNPATCATDLCVPLKLTPYVETLKFPRATNQIIYAQVVYDLLEAERLLTLSPQQEAHRLYRASAEAADLLLSRVLLYMQQWELAELKADAAMKSSHHSLATLDQLEENSAFLTENNPEIFFSQGTNFLNSTSIFTGRAGDFCVTEELYRLYDEKDKRRSVFFSASVSAGGVLTDSVALANKYHREDSYRDHVSDAFTLRMAEAYLNKAEACAMQPGKEATALAILNELRGERISDYTPQSYSGEELVKQIRDERRKELCFEGHRWFDLRRYAANEAHPYSKKILRVINVVGSNIAFLYNRGYVLNENDHAYTFSLPKDVLEFDEISVNNPREKRDPLQRKDEETTQK